METNPNPMAHPPSCAALSSIVGCIRRSHGCMCGPLGGGTCNLSPSLASCCLSPRAMGPGHVSLMTNVDGWHSGPFINIWYLLIYYDTWRARQDEEQEDAPWLGLTSTGR